jgi:hypothetical protein
MLAGIVLLAETTRSARWVVNHAPLSDTEKLPMSLTDLLFGLVLLAIALFVPCSVALAMYLKGQRRPYYQISRR